MEESIFKIAEQINQLHKKAYDTYLPLVDDVCVREVSGYAGSVKWFV